ncbi:MAG: hydroxymethylglutaryl-CoA synthase [Candidatus Hydrothermarchaeota archaeon]
MSLPKSWRNIPEYYRLIASKDESRGLSIPPRYIDTGRGREGEVIYESLMWKDASLYSYSKKVENGFLYYCAIVEIDGAKVSTYLTDMDREPEIGMELEPTFRRLGETKEGVIKYGLAFRPKQGSKSFKKKNPVKKFDRAGIVGYGVHIPKYRIKMEEMAKEMKKDPKILINQTGFKEKAVLAPDQDTTTIGVDAAKNALKYACIDGSEIGSIRFGSESPPYAVKPSAITVAEAIGATPRVEAHDMECACKAATGGFIYALSVVENGYFECDYSMVVGADNSQAEEGDVLDNTVGCGAAAFIFGKYDVIASLEAYEPYTTDIPDFWRREGSPFPRHGGGFTGDPAYFKHTQAAAINLMERTGIEPHEIDHVVLHQPNGKFPWKAAQRLGFTWEQYKLGFVADWIGNAYSASTLIGLANIFDHARDNELILHVAFGSGAGADAFLWRTEEPILWKEGITVQEQLKRKIYVNYHTYRKTKNG